jgi:hypothetical protein
MLAVSQFSISKKKSGVLEIRVRRRAMSLPFGWGNRTNAMTEGELLRASLAAPPPGAHPDRNAMKKVAKRKLAFFLNSPLLPHRMK